MKLWAGHYLNAGFKIELSGTLFEHLPAPERVRIICIDSIRNIPDCFGPFCGSLLQTALPDTEILGTLSDPWHAGNHQLRMQELKVAEPKINFVIDAAAGKDELGTILLRRGVLYPGKASGKRLKPIGDINLTAVTAPQPYRFLKARGTGMDLRQVALVAHKIKTALNVWAQSGP